MEAGKHLCLRRTLPKSLKIGFFYIPTAYYVYLSLPRGWTFSVPLAAKHSLELVHGWRGAPMFDW